ncbi:BPSL0761 family protein [Xanthomonas arboricola]|uniref:BPSL0761 family protein n=1 Tax=Xanthomonas arboricola TaxID=56448 RepID=UPI003CE476AF
MTLPDERTRNLLQSGAFLKELAGNQAAPKSVRQEAIGCCIITRHSVISKPSPNMKSSCGTSPGRRLCDLI